MKFATKAYMLIITTLIQGIIVFLIANKTLLQVMGGYVVGFEFMYFTSILLYLLVFASMFILYYIIKFLETEKQSISKINDSKEIIGALRAQKHDFLNHLAVVSGMLQLGKMEEPLKYINQISGQVG